MRFPGGSTKSDARGAGLKPDQPRILDRRLPVLDRLAVEGIADHGDEGGDARIFGDETEIPALVGRPDQHELEPAAPDDPSAKTEKTGRLSRP